MLIVNRRITIASVLTINPACTRRLCGMRFVNAAAAGETISSISDIGSSVRPVWKASTISSYQSAITRAHNSRLPLK